MMDEQSGMPSKFVDAADGRLHYQESGAGDPVFLIHGGGPGAYGYSNYRRNIAALSLENRVIVIDLPGFGQSATRQRPDGIYKALAHAVRDVMDHENIAKASMVGNSLGGGTAIRFALDHPDRVDKLVLMGPGGGMPVFSPTPTEGLGRMLNFYEGEGPTREKLEKIVDLLVFDRSSMTSEILEERYKTATLPNTVANPPLRGRGNARDELWREGLGSIQAPTLLIWGRDDRVIPLDGAFLMLKVIPNADLHVFSKCGHWAQWERAEEFNEVVGNFLKRH